MKKLLILLVSSVSALGQPIIPNPSPGGGGSSTTVVVSNSLYVAYATNSGSAGTATNAFAPSTNTLWLSALGTTAIYNDLATAIGAVSNLNGTPAVLKLAPGFTYTTPYLWSCSVTNLSIDAGDRATTLINLREGGTNTSTVYTIFSFYGACNITGGHWTSYPTNGTQNNIGIFFDATNGLMPINSTVKNARFSGWTDTINANVSNTNNCWNVLNNIFDVFFQGVSFQPAPTVIASYSTSNRKSYNNTFNFNYNTIYIDFTNDTYINSTLAANATIGPLQSVADVFQCSFNSFIVNSTCITNTPLNETNNTKLINLLYGNYQTGPNTWTNIDYIGPNAYFFNSNNVSLVEIYFPIAAPKEQIYMVGDYDWYCSSNSTRCPIKYQGGLPTGTAQLAFGTNRVLTSAIQYNSKLQLSYLSIDGTLALIGYKTNDISPGVAFTIISGNITDTNQVNWFIVP